MDPGISVRHDRKEQAPQPATTGFAPPRVVQRHVEVDGLRIFYRAAEAPEGTPTLLLLHGFPSRISVPDYAAAIVDTLESGRFRGARFTAAY
jgi:hypothetical protein